VVDDISSAKVDQQRPSICESKLSYPGYGVLTFVYGEKQSSLRRQSYPLDIPPMLKCKCKGFVTIISQCPLRGTNFTRSKKETLLPTGLSSAEPSPTKTMFPCLYTVPTRLENWIQYLIVHKHDTWKSDLIGTVFAMRRSKGKN
jgi:hypothetical protein